MLKNKKVVIFDMDGTLIDSIGIWNAIDEELIKTIGDGTIDNVDIAKQRDDKLVTAIYNPGNNKVIKAAINLINFVKLENRAF